MSDALLVSATTLAPDFGVPLPEAAIQNGGGIRASIDELDPITALDTFNVAQFFNLVSVVPDVPREQFRQLLERAVSADAKAPPTAGLEPEGRFGQIAGFRFTYDVTGQAQQLDAEGNVSVPGDRVREVVLDDGTTIVADGEVQDGPPINVATIDFMARGGDGYPFMGAEFATLGVTYQQALRDIIEGTLGGVVTAGEYPEGGEGRIIQQP
jgi:5'-nucleotidase